MPDMDLEADFQQKFGTPAAQQPQDLNADFQQRFAGGEPAVSPFAQFTGGRMKQGIETAPIQADSGDEQLQGYAKTEAKRFVNGALVFNPQMTKAQQTDAQSAFADELQGHLQAELLKKHVENETNYLQSGYFGRRGTLADVIKTIPGARTGYRIGEAYELKKAVEDYQANKATPDQYQLLAGHLARNQYDAGAGFMQKVSDISRELPAEVAEWMMLAGPAGKAGEAGAKGAAELGGSALTQWAAKQVAAASLRTVLRPDKLAEQTLSRMTPSLTQNQEGGLQTKPGEALPSAVGKAVEEQLLNNLAFEATGTFKGKAGFSALGIGGSTVKALAATQFQPEVSAHLGGAGGPGGVVTQLFNAKDGEERSKILKDFAAQGLVFGTLETLMHGFGKGAEPQTPSEPGAAPELGGPEPTAPSGEPGSAPEPGAAQQAKAPPVPEVYQKLSDYVAWLKKQGYSKEEIIERVNNHAQDFARTNPANEGATRAKMTEWANRPTVSDGPEREFLRAMANLHPEEAEPKAGPTPQEQPQPAQPPPQPPPQPPATPSGSQTRTEGPTLPEAFGEGIDQSAEAMLPQLGLKPPEPPKPTRFAPGGPLENLGGMAAKFGETVIHVIPSPDNPKIAFITGMKGRDVASVTPQIIEALKAEGFTDLQYRPDNEDGRAAARTRLFESLRQRFNPPETPTTPPEPSEPPEGPKPVSPTLKPPEASQGPPETDAQYETRLAKEKLIATSHAGAPYAIEKSITDSGAESYSEYEKSQRKIGLKGKSYQPRTKEELAYAKAIFAQREAESETRPSSFEDFTMPELRDHARNNSVDYRDLNKAALIDKFKQLGIKPPLNDVFPTQTPEFQDLHQRFLAGDQNVKFEDVVKAAKLPQIEANAILHLVDGKEANEIIEQPDMLKEDGSKYTTANISALVNKARRRLQMSKDRFDALLSQAMFDRASNPDIEGKPTLVVPHGELTDTQSQVQSNRDVNNQLNALQNRILKQIENGTYTKEQEATDAREITRLAQLTQGRSRQTKQKPLKWTIPESTTVGNKPPSVRRGPDNVVSESGETVEATPESETATGSTEGARQSGGPPASAERRTPGGNLLDPNDPTGLRKLLGLQEGGEGGAVDLDRLKELAKRAVAVFRGRGYANEKSEKMVKGIDNAVEETKGDRKQFSELEEHLQGTPQLKEYARAKFEEVNSRRLPLVTQEQIEASEKRMEDAKYPAYNEHTGLRYAHNDLLEDARLELADGKTAKQTVASLLQGGQLGEKEAADPDTRKYVEAIVDHVIVLQKSRQLSAPLSAEDFAAWRKSEANRKDVENRQREQAAEGVEAAKKKAGLRAEKADLSSTEFALNRDEQEYEIEDRIRNNEEPKDVLKDVLEKMGDKVTPEIKDYLDAYVDYQKKAVESETLTRREPFLSGETGSFDPQATIAGVIRTYHQIKNFLFKEAPDETAEVHAEAKRAGLAPAAAERLIAEANRQAEDSARQEVAGSETPGGKSSTAAEPDILYSAIPLPSALVEPVTKWLGAIGSSLRVTFNPASVSQFSQATAGNLRQGLSELANRDDVAGHALYAARAFFDRAVVAEKDPIRRTTNFLGFTDPYEKGQTSQLPPQLQELAATIKKLKDEATAELVKQGLLQSFIDHHLGHLWKDPRNPNATPEELAARMGARRPMAGSEGFRKQRVMPTWRDGIDAGLEPATWNPIEAELSRLHEMYKSIFGRTVFDEEKDAGRIVYVPLGQSAPVGMVLVPDKFATQYAHIGSANLPTLVGHWYAPEESARLIDRFLSPGIRGNPIFDAAMGLSNEMNKLNLGWSAYHAVGTALNAQMNAMEFGLRQVLVGSLGQSIPNLIKGLIPLTATFHDLWQGNNLNREWYNPGSGGAEMADLLKSFEMAGGRAHMGSEYQFNAIEQFRTAIRQKAGLYSIIGAGLRAINEAVSWPIMSKLVPLTKMGAFANRAAAVLENLGPNATVDEKRAALYREWQSIENRMGQVTYDNLFWSRILRDAMHISIRSVGWNAGDIGEAGGAAADIPSSVKAAAKGKLISPRIAYLIAMPIVAGISGALIQYLMTGKGPDETKDLYFPKTGRIRDDGSEDRLSLPTYMKDFYSLSQKSEKGPWQWSENVYHAAMGKRAPLVTTGTEMLSNKDFFDKPIRNPDDPLVQQTQAEILHFLGGVQPLSTKAKEGATPGERGLSVLGLTPAPSYITRGPGGDAVNDFYDQLKRTQDLHRQATHAAQMGKPLPDYGPKEIGHYRRMEAFDHRMSELNKALLASRKDEDKVAIKALKVKVARNALGQ